MINDNKVELLGYYGSDEIHACSAWTSTSREVDDKKRERIPGLLKFLAGAGHHTPFEKSSIHFLVGSEIASHIHMLKHRIGVSINGESARYKELQEDKYFIPEDWKGIYASEDIYMDGERVVVGEKAAELEFLDKEDWASILKNYNELGNSLYHLALKDLEPVLGRKRSKESARFFKPYSSQIDCDIMFNWRSFVHFLGLRKKPDAQKEIREIATKMLDLVKSIEGNPFKYTIEAFGLNE